MLLGLLRLLLLAPLPPGPLGISLLWWLRKLWLSWAPGARLGDERLLPSWLQASVLVLSDLNTCFF